MIKNKQKLKGFTLVEVLITLTILAIGMVAVSALMVRNIRTAQEARRLVVASQLAQEGIELMRNLKDNNVNFNSTSQCGGKLANGNDYKIDKTINGTADCTTMTFNTNAANNPLYVDDGSIAACGTNISGFFTYNNVCGSNSRTKTNYYRAIAVDNSTAGQVKITSTVSWSGSGIPATCSMSNKCISVIAVFSD